MSSASPNPPGMPDPPSGSFYNDTQWTVLIALLDAVIPSITPESLITDKKTQLQISDSEYQKVLMSIRNSMVEPPDDDEVLKTYLDGRPSKDPAFAVALRRSLSSVPDAGRRQLGTVLSTLATRPGSFFLTGYCTPIHYQPVHIRHSILRSWRTSYLGTPRLLFKTFTMLAQSIWLTTSPLFTRISGFPDVPQDWKPAGSAFEYSFLQLENNAEPAVLETDVVIVGSGCGGSVCAKVLSEAGHRVLVVDKGYYFPPSQLPMPQAQGMQHLFENGGFMQSVDSSVSLVAGSCWGGGGTVNWSVSLQTQGYVRREWAEDHGLPFFATQGFQDCLDRVCDFMGVTDKNVRQSHRGQVLLDGARKLGWHARPAPQNCGGKNHYCGHCHLGCSSMGKQGPVVSWLPAAARNGATFMEGFMVGEVIFEDEKVTGDRKKAVGVKGRWTSRDRNGGVVGPADQRVTRDVIIKAKKVIISSGSLWSPLVLMSSGLKNRHIGRHLCLHPVNFVTAYYPEDARPWEGGIITSLCSTFENLDGNGHGVKLESTCMIPYTILTPHVWTSGLDLKLSAVKYRHMAGFISLARDRDTGRVYPDPVTGRPTVEYTPSAFDSAHILEGVIALAKICYITGAEEIRAGLPGVEPFVRRPKDAKYASATDMINSTGDVADGKKALDPGVTDPLFATWLSTLRSAGNKPPYAAYSSAHQMGTCRMSSHEGAGVVDGRGRVWEAKGLFVADASVFPSASGVNPMVTNMAIAEWIATGVRVELAKENGE